MNEPQNGKAIRAVTALVVVALGAVAAYVSYTHAYEVASEHGEAGLSGRLLPLTIDGLVFVASMVLLDSARRGLSAPGLAKWSLGAGIGATVAANVLHGAPHGAVGATISAWPAITLVLAVELLMGLIRRGRTAAATDQVQPRVAEDDRPVQEPPPGLGDAVRSAKAAGASIRAIAAEFGITRYQVSKHLGDHAGN